MRVTRRSFVQGAAAVSALAPRWACSANTAPDPAHPLKILILGGTGFIGPHQVRYALSRGHQVTLFNRGRQPHDWPGVEELIGDRNTGDLKALGAGRWDACIDNPTTLPFWVRDAGRALRDKVGHYIFISTISVYAANDRPADERAAVVPYAGKDAMAETAETLKASGGKLYGPLKAVCEQEAAAQFPGMTTVIRPGLIVGPGDETDRFTYWPIRLARGGEVLAPGDGSDPVQFIDARDLAEWTIRVAEARALGVFNAIGPARPLTTRAMLSEIAVGLNVEPRLTWVSVDFLKAQRVSPWRDLPVWIPAQGDRAGFARRDIGRALDAGLVFRPLPQTAADTLAWFKSLPLDRQTKLRAGLSAEREAALLANWSASAKAGQP